MPKQQKVLIDNETLKTERQQLVDEGRDIAALADEFSALAALDLEADPSLQPRAAALMDGAASLPMRADYPYDEPSDLEGIRRARPDGPRRFEMTLDDAALFDRVLGAWLGRCAGCLLGKPVEGWHTPRIWGYLKDLGRYPLDDYFRADVPPEIAEKYMVGARRSFIDQVDCMVEDDDLNYTVTGLAILTQHGPDFTPDDVANFWLRNIPVFRTYTAERVAYRNFLNLILPPASATYHNPYREWIGAQIRADFWGYAALGDLERAAEFAWRDACVSHVKNGIYGEMWVAAMLAAAPYLDDVRAVIDAGLSEVPRASRLAADIEEVKGWRDAGIDYEEAIRRIHARWDETWMHHWCHTNSNAQIVVLGLLWGEGDYEKSICRAVQAGFDTDCNGATVGSVYGMMHGAKALPEKWIGPLNDTLETGVAGYYRVRISEIAREGFDLYMQLRGQA
ncbi:MAG: ADP-ribosylglycohydrolase family protein [Anaerolineae bacterium]